MAESDNQNAISKWPWDGQKEKLTATVQSEIVKNLAIYANQAAYCKPEVVGMSTSLDAVFLGYCFVVKEDFKKKAKTKPQAKTIADEAIQQIDRLYRWVRKPDDSFLVLLNEWDSLLQRFNMCMDSVQQKTEQVKKLEETKRNAHPVKDEEREDVIVPKPPEFLQKLLWMLKYGKKHWMLLLLAAIIIFLWFVIQFVF